MTKKHLTSTLLVVFTLSLGLSACQSTGGRGGYRGPRPILYPNEHYRQVGIEVAEMDISNCMYQADRSVPQQDQLGNTAKNTLGGAAGGAALGAIGGAILGNAGTGAAAGAALGAGAGLIKSGLDANKTDPNYTGWVNACLADKGYQVTGWQ